jgi:hypothetical protein
MRILKLSLLVSLILLSCQNNQESSSSPIIGKWSEIIETENGVDYTSECTPLNTLEFIKDGTFIIVSYASLRKGTEPLECVFEGETKTSWRVEENILFTKHTMEDEKTIEVESKFSIENDILTTKHGLVINSYRKY